MRRCIAELIFLTWSTGLLAQGTVNFNNSPGAVGGFGVPLFASYPDSSYLKLEGADWLTQLYAGPDAGSLQPWGNPLTFRTGAGAGFFDTRGVNPVRVIGTVAPGAVAAIEVRVWQAAGGLTFEQAMAGGFYGGSSTQFTITTGGAGAPPSLPANLVGLTSFTILVPEPATYALLAFGILGVWCGGGFRRLSTAST